MCGCFFRLSQSFFKHVKKLSSYKEYLLGAEFRLCFKLTQSLAFLPENDVVDGYDYIYKYATDECPQYIPMLAYVEKVYIGTLKAARYPIPTWNCYKRVMSGASRTTNKKVGMVNYKQTRINILVSSSSLLFEEKNKA
jgi:hypothetical protein